MSGDPYYRDQITTRDFEDPRDVYLYGEPRIGLPSLAGLEAEEPALQGEEINHFFFKSIYIVYEFVRGLDKTTRGITNDRDLAEKLSRAGGIVQQFRKPINGYEKAMNSISWSCGNDKHWFGEWHHKTGKARGGGNKDIVGASERVLRSIIKIDKGYTEKLMADYMITREWKVAEADKKEEDAKKKAEADKVTAGPAAAINSALHGTSVQSLMRLSDNTVADPIVGGKGKAPAANQ